MISYVVYKWLHVIGIFLMLLALGSLSEKSIQKPLPKLKKAMHGIGMFIVLLGGFGMLARLGIHYPWPAWVWGKVVIWIALGFILVPIRRVPKCATIFWWSSWGLAAAAAYLALFKV